MVEVRSVPWSADVVTLQDARMCRALANASGGVRCSLGDLELAFPGWSRDRRWRLLELCGAGVSWRVVGDELGAEYCEACDVEDDLVVCVSVEAWLCWLDRLWRAARRLQRRGVRAYWWRTCLVRLPEGAPDGAAVTALRMYIRARGDLQGGAGAVRRYFERLHGA